MSEEQCSRFKTVAAGAVAFVTETEQTGDQESWPFKGGTELLAKKGLQ